MSGRHSEENNFRAGCAGKIGYETPKKAKAAIRALTKRRLPQAERLTAYHCVWCHDYHVGRRHKTEAKVSQREAARRRKLSIMRLQCKAVTDDDRQEVHPR
jgi:hypothetical protein